MRVFPFVLAAFALLVSPAARAEPEVRALRHDATLDGAITLSAGALWVASEIMKAELVPEKCRWCYRTKTGDDALNRIDFGVRHALRWNRTDAAGALSSWIAFVGLPALAGGGLSGLAAYDGAIGGAPTDLLLTAEATLLAVDLNQLVKFVFARERPFVHFLPHAPDGARELTESPSDDNLSFYSGHTNLAFALATSSGTLAFARGYRLAPVLLGAGLAGAFTVGWLRIAADKHYFSDVMVGAVVGSLVGAGVPLLFHRGRDTAAASSTGTASQGLGLPVPTMPFGWQGSF